MAESNFSALETEQEKKMMVNKLFNLAETPLYEWLARFTGIDVRELTDEYNEQKDVISFAHGDKYYKMYLSSADDCVKIHDVFSNEEFNGAENARKASSMLYDAVYTAYHSVANVINLDEKNTHIKQMFPMFHEPTKSFRLFMPNVKKIRKDKLYKSLTTVLSNLIRIDQNIDAHEQRLLRGPTPAEKDKIMDELKNLHGFKARTLEDRENVIREYNEISDDDINAHTEECKQINDRYADSCRLYMALSVSNMGDQDAARTLPSVGITGINPDDGDIVDRINESQE